MHWQLLTFFDLIGTIAFAISGALVAIQNDMDIFGVNVLAITTACGGGMMRDIVIGHIPPTMFVSPRYVLVASIMANIVFVLIYSRQHMPKKVAPIYDHVLFWFDTLGLAAFTVDGVYIGIQYGYRNHLFLIIFLGFITGVGGGALRDIMADRKPDIFVKNIYASASIAGAICMVVLFFQLYSWRISMFGSFIVIILLRYFAAKFHWNLPKISHQ